MRDWEPCPGISKREENSPKERLGTISGKLPKRGEFSKRETRNHVEGSSKREENSPKERLETMSGKLQKRGEFSKRETGNHVGEAPKERRILQKRDWEPCWGISKREESSPKERLGTMSDKLPKERRILQKRDWEPSQGSSKREENSPKERLGTVSGKLQKRGEFSKRETGNHVGETPKERRIPQNRDWEPCQGRSKREENSPKERLGTMSGKLLSRGEFFKRETGNHVREAPKERRILQKRDWEPCRGIP